MLAEQYTQELENLKNKYIKKLGDFIQKNTESTNIREVRYSIIWDDVKSNWVGFALLFTNEALRTGARGYDPIFGPKTIIEPQWMMNETDFKIAHQIGEHMQQNMKLFGDLMGDKQQPVNKNFHSVKKNQLSLSI